MPKSPGSSTSGSSHASVSCSWGSSLGPSGAVPAGALTARTKANAAWAAASESSKDGTSTSKSKLRAKRNAFLYSVMFCLTKVTPVVSTTIRVAREVDTPTPSQVAPAARSADACSPSVISSRSCLTKCRLKKVLTQVGPNSSPPTFNSAGSTSDISLRFRVFVVELWLQKLDRRDVTVSRRQTKAVRKRPRKAKS